MKIKNIKQVGVNPVYDISVKDAEHYILENGIMSHNTGAYYGADCIFILGRQQDKDKTEKTILGYKFIINVEKSRYIREKSKIPVDISFDNGISKWSGLLEVAQESKHVIKPKNGWYVGVDSATGEIIGTEVKEAKTACAAFWEPILSQQSFKDFVEKKYKLSNKNLLSDTAIDQAMEEAEDSLPADEF